MGFRSTWNSHWILAEEVILAHWRYLAGVNLECAWSVPRADAGEDAADGLTGGGAGVVLLFAGDVLAGDRDAQLAEEAEIVLGEGLVGAAASGDFDLLGLLGGEVVESDGGLEHEQHIEAVTTDVLDDAGDLLVLDDRLVDGLAELLNEFAHTDCHRRLQGLRPARGCAGSGMGFIYLTSVGSQEQVGTGGSRIKAAGTPPLLPS